MAEMKGIKLCGECINYDWKKHKCKIGCNDDSNAQAPFYGDCPLPDVVPKSEVDFLRASQNLHEAEFNEIKAELELRNSEIETLKARLDVSKVEVAREIFEEIEDDISDTISRLLVSIDLREKETSDVNDHDVLIGYGRLYALRNIEELLAVLKKKYTE